jgi:hypothetical protein
MDDNNTKIDIDDFCDEYYFAGVFDAEGTVGINKRENKYVDTDRFTPFVSFVNTNKKILSCCCSTLKNKEIGFFIATRDKQKRNRVRWDVKTSGIKRVISLAEKIMDKTTVKTQQLNLIYSYCNARLKEPKSINDIGLSFKASIEALNK